MSRVHLAKKNVMLRDAIMKLNEQNCKNVRLEEELSDVHIKEEKQVDKELLPRIQEELMTSNAIAKDHPVNGLFERSDSTLTSVNLLCNATCLLTWEVPKKNKKSQQFGRAFLCSLPVDYGYEVILCFSCQKLCSSFRCSREWGGSIQWLPSLLQKSRGSHWRNSF